MRRALLLLAALAAASPAPARGAAADRRTLERLPDPVVVRGRRLSGLLGESIAGFGLLAVNRGTWAPIPVQVDQRGDDGALLYDRGEVGDPIPGAGLLKPRDELVFMARDAGDRWLGPASLAPPKGARGGVEIALAESVRGSARPGLAWAYLFAFAGTPPRSAEDYVSYDHDAGRIRGRSYTMTFSPGEDTIYFRAVSIPPSAGGTGQNIVDRLKIRMHLKTHLFFSLVFDEDDWDSSVRRWIDGPVRVVREVDNELSFLGVDVAPRVLVESTFYAEHHAAPTEIRQTVNIPSIAREAWLVSSVDLSEEAKGMRYYRARSPDQDPWRLIDGAPTEDERGLDPRRPPWHLIVGPQGAMIWRMDLPEPLAPITRLTFRDDQSDPDPPERVPGRIGEIGYRVDLFPLERGAYRMWTYYMFPPAWSPGVERDYQRMIDRPLEVSVRPLGAL